MKEVHAEFQPLTNLMNIVRAPHFSAAQKDASELCTRFGKDGLKAVQCIIAAHPNLSKSEKLEYEKAARQMFAGKKSDGSGQTYNASPSLGILDDSDAADDVSSEALKQQNGKATSGWGWFGRRG